jgi:hypothetical protein
MEPSDKPKAKRAPRAKKATATATAATESIVAAFGGAPPAIFIEEVEAPAPPPPQPAAKSKPAKKATGGKKPPVIAAVTPDGVQGSLTALSEQRPLIAHLPIHSADIDNDMFATEGSAQVGGDGQPPRPYDPDDMFMNYGEKKAAPSVANTSTQAEEPAAASRPSLPLHYSEKLMIRFQDANRSQALPDHTDVACFWCCHPFRSQPCVIPTGIEEEIWRVYGNFCCPECAAAYLFNERLDSHVQWERYALLNRLYARGEEPVRLAPPRTVLRMFGGTLDVSEFRSIVADRQMRVDVNTPPMISIIQVMDTKPIDFYDASMKNSFIPWEMDRMNRPGAQGLRLRRTKPVAEKESTLEYCMGIVS